MHCNVCADLDPQNNHLTRHWLKEKGPKRKETLMNMVVINWKVNTKNNLTAGNMEIRSTLKFRKIRDEQ